MIGKISRQGTRYVLYHRGRFPDHVLKNTITDCFSEAATAPGPQKVLPSYLIPGVVPVSSPNSHCHFDLMRRKQIAAMPHDRICRENIIEWRKLVTPAPPDKQTEIFCMAI